MTSTWHSTPCGLVWETSVEEGVQEHVSLRVGYAGLVRLVCACTVIGLPCTAFLMTPFLCSQLDHSLHSFGNCTALGAKGSALALLPLHEQVSDSQAAAAKALMAWHWDWRRQCPMVSLARATAARLD